MLTGNGTGRIWRPPSLLSNGHRGFFRRD